MSYLFSHLGVRRLSFLLILSSGCAGRVEGPVTEEAGGAGAQSTDTRPNGGMGATNQGTGTNAGGTSGAPGSQPPPQGDLVPLKIRHLVASDYSTCWLRGDRVRCWGRNWEGQLGIGVTGIGTDRHTPVTPIGLDEGVTSITGSHTHFCAFVRDEVRCWGRNFFGQLGDGTKVDSGTPVRVSVMPGRAKLLVAGYTKTCATDESGHFGCWGGEPDSPSAFPSFAESNLRNVDDISLADRYTCIKNAEGVSCWGVQGFGSSGPTDYVRAPWKVLSSAEGVSEIDSGYVSTCALVDGGVWCWGNRDDAVLGSNRQSASSTWEPRPITGLERDVTALSVGAYHACAIQNGAAKCWGWCRFGRLGDGIDSSAQAREPVQVIGLTENVTEISAGGFHTCALVGTDRVKCWGHNDSGPLGNDSVQDSAVPVDVLEPIE